MIPRETRPLPEFFKRASLPDSRILLYSLLMGEAYPVNVQPLVCQTTRQQGFEWPLDLMAIGLVNLFSCLEKKVKCFRLLPEKRWPQGVERG